MKTIQLFPILVLLASMLQAQGTPTGVNSGTSGTPLPTLTFAKMSPSTYAVVIGVSDYQSPQIPDLQFAHRDAQAFAAWLASPAGGNVPANNVRLLINEQAKNAQVGAELDGLMENAKHGDLAIIYFSGHGDVETKTRNQFGFLLPWDSPPNNYKAGAYPLIYLQDVISTLSDKDVRVVVVTDACHAGKLAGSIIGGTQATAQKLSQQFANEVKIMSCQPNELSLEGAQWGGGRGVFSYNLLDGLTGLADKNGDAMVSLFEIDRYLGDVVPEQTAPHQQFPMVSGDKQFRLVQVDAASLAALKAEKAAAKSSSLAATTGKGLIDGLLTDSDSALLKLYRDFEAALEKGDLLEGSPSANELFIQLIKEEKLQPVHGLMRRNLAAALQNEPQQALNALLESDPYEANSWLYNPQKYETYPRQLERAIELLGEKHYMRRSLESKKLYFEAYLLARSLQGEGVSRMKSDSIREAAKSIYLKAAGLEPEAAYIYQSIGNMYMWSMPALTDSVVRYETLAIEQAPAWLMPYLDVSYEIHYSLSNLEEASKWLLRGIELNPNSYLAQERLSWLRQWQDRTEESLEICQKMIEAKPALFNAYATAGVTHLMRKEYDKAFVYFNKSMELNSSPAGNWAFAYMVLYYAYTRRFPEAINWAKKILADSTLELPAKIQIYSRLTDAAAEVADVQLLTQFGQDMEKLNERIGVPFPYYWHRAKSKMLLGAYQEAIELFELDISTDSYTKFASSALIFECQAQMAAKKGDTTAADSLFRRAFTHQPGKLIALDNRIQRTSERILFHYAYFLIQQNRQTEALAQLNMAQNEEPFSYYPPYGRALLEAKNGNEDAALNWLEKSLDYYYPRKEPIMAEPLFKKIRNTERFKNLMAKHFKGQ